MSVQDFLAVVAGNMNVPVERMEPIAKKLHDEFYEDVASLKEISPSDWSSFGFPKRVTDKILELLNDTKAPDESTSYCMQ
jgi:hypothetical protein